MGAARETTRSWKRQLVNTQAALNMAAAGAKRPRAGIVVAQAAPGKDGGANLGRMQRWAEDGARGKLDDALAEGVRHPRCGLEDAADRGDRKNVALHA